MTSPADVTEQDAIAAEGEGGGEAGEDAGDEQDDLAAEWESMVGDECSGMNWPAPDTIVSAIAATTLASNGRGVRNSLLYLVAIRRSKTRPQAIGPG